MDSGGDGPHNEPQSVIPVSIIMPPEAITGWLARSCGLTCIDSNRMTPEPKQAIKSPAAPIRNQTSICHAA